mmetsp:Transcript_3041/g.5175  ORF Transcript_3041/g.5175 Transcript_3041/m.5175 type:complete len:201 (-) Transcript_3041:490-1092(-)
MRLRSWRAIEKSVHNLRLGEANRYFTLIPIIKWSTARRRFSYHTIRTNMSDAPETGTERDWSHLYKDERKFGEPILLEAEIVHGFGRGSKELGIPTANLSMDVLGPRGENLETGIYYGWSHLNSCRYQTVVSVGWNPFYKNEKKTVEAHLLSKLPDFYGEILKVELLGYLRQETNFNGVDDLISCINSDIDLTKKRLESA